MSQKLRQFANIMAWSGVVAFNAISQALPLNGQTNADVANRYPDLLYFPANYAFSIWGVIYTFLLAFVIYQTLPSQRENDEIQKIGYLFVVSSIFNAAWIFAFQYNQFILSLIIMIALLVTLLAIYIRLEIGVAPVSTKDKWLVHIPFSIYLGWITAATITNTAFVLTDLGWNGFGIPDETWAIIMLAITGLLGVLIVWLRRDIAYGLVIVWAVTAIASRYNGTEFSTTTTVSLIVAAIVAVVIALRLFTMFTNRNQPMPVGQRVTAS